MEMESDNSFPSPAYTVHTSLPFPISRVNATQTTTPSPSPPPNANGWRLPNLPTSPMSISSSPLPLAVLFLLIARASLATRVATEFLYPPFNATHVNFVETSGNFLVSPTAVFALAFANPGASQQSRFYLSLIHTATSTAVWSANRDSPVPQDGIVALSALGLTVSLPNRTVVWATPTLSSAVRALRLLDSGNLLLLDAANVTLWQSFDRPTDTLLSGQPLRSGSSLTASISEKDFATGDYSLAVTTRDAVMAWKGGQEYWSISTDVRSLKDSSAGVASMAANATGLYLFSAEGKVVFEVFLPTSDFRIMWLDSLGRFNILSYAAANSSSVVGDEFTAPSNNCDLPSPCSSLSICSAAANVSKCVCPPSFVPSEAGGCVPADGSLLPSSTSASCGSDSGMTASYIKLGGGVQYFANKFATPAMSGGDISACQSLCTGNCSCQGFFYKSSSMSCYLLQDQLGSLINNSVDGTSTTSGFIKTLVSASSPSPSSGGTSKTHLVAILLPTVTAFLLSLVVVSMGFMWKRNISRRRPMRRRSSKKLVTKEIKLGRQKSSRTASSGAGSDETADEDDDSDILIPGLPTRFTYAELEAATNSFRTRIGSGGFGAVYKGELPDKTVVAVKRIENVGLQGRKEFCTEIAIISNIRHVNLVRLRGFCAQGNRRLLVYEFMSRASLDRSLFGAGPVLEWQERVDIAVGAARGLAYLHAGCEHKIIHCDVKPENILLHDGGQVKIGDFGLAKLMAPEQSGFFTTMRGTRGYLAPEWLTNTAITDRTDVYSFGMVLLEIVRGRKNRLYSSEEVEDGNGSGWSGVSSAAWSDYFPLAALERHEEGRYMELADPRMEGRVEELEVARVVKVALCCLHEEPGLRPSMAAVVGILDGSVAVWEPRVESLNFLRLYGRGYVEPPPLVVGDGDGAVGSAGGTHTPSAISVATIAPGSIQSGS
ncbi:hypothetical protein Cni_G00907 [Canna indica]|uniref:Non-specific serine/threonine protein kinase n=1 Tax=Canna indica TaxID=4628 RepID=A0AAQ3JNM2_9LILI|nr:hypothetical protein Cni_G00907 [Canna indica]